MSKLTVQPYWSRSINFNFGLVNSCNKNEGPAMTGPSCLILTWAS